MLHGCCRDKFSIAFGSLFQHAKFNDGETLHLHFVCDQAGRNFAQDYLQKHVAHPTFAFKVSYLKIIMMV